MLNNPIEIRPIYLQHALTAVHTLTAGTPSTMPDVFETLADQLQFEILAALEPAVDPEILDALVDPDFGQRVVAKY